MSKLVRRWVTKRSMLIAAVCVCIAVTAYASFRGDLKTHGSLSYDYANPSTLTVDGHLNVNGNITYTGALNRGTIIIQPGSSLPTETHTADDNTSEMMDVQYVSEASGVDDGQTMRLSWWTNNDDSATTKEMAALDVSFDDTSSGTEDASFKFYLQVAGTLTNLFNFTLDGLGLENGEFIGNNTDAEVTVTADDNTSQQLDLQLRNTTASTNDTDTIRISAWMDDDYGEATEFGAIDFIADDMTTATEDGSIKLWAQTAGTLTNAGVISSATAAFPGAVTAATLTINSTETFDGIWSGTDSIASGATSDTVSLAAIGSGDVVNVTPMESFTTATWYVKVEPGIGFDVVLVDVNGGDASANAPQALDYMYMVVSED